MLSVSNLLEEGVTKTHCSERQITLTDFSAINSNSICTYYTHDSLHYIFYSFSLSPLNTGQIFGDREFPLMRDFTSDFIWSTYHEGRGVPTFKEF